jgi:hypothetical protein
VYEAQIVPGLKKDAGIGYCGTRYHLKYRYPPGAAWGYGNIRSRTWIVKNVILVDGYGNVMVLGMYLINSKGSIWIFVTNV